MEEYSTSLGSDLSLELENIARKVSYRSKGYLEESDRILHMERSIENLNEQLQKLIIAQSRNTPKPEEKKVKPKGEEISLKLKSVCSELDILKKQMGLTETPPKRNSIVISENNHELSMISDLSSRTSTTTRPETPTVKSQLPIQIPKSPSSPKQKKKDSPVKLVDISNINNSATGHVKKAKLDNHIKRKTSPIKLQGSPKKRIDSPTKRVSFHDLNISELMEEELSFKLKKYIDEEMHKQYAMLRQELNDQVVKEIESKLIEHKIFIQHEIDILNQRIDLLLKETSTTPTKSVKTSVRSRQSSTSSEDSLVDLNTQKKQELIQDKQAEILLKKLRQKLQQKARLLKELEVRVDAPIPKSKKKVIKRAFKV